MRLAEVEIYSDATNAAIIRHPDRRFPGVLIQGDTLRAMCRVIDLICGSVELRPNTTAEAEGLREQLLSLLKHYECTLVQHGIELPFFPGVQDCDNRKT